MNGKLKVGLLVDNNKLPAWQYALVEKLAVSGSADIELLMWQNIKTKAKNAGLIRKFHEKLDKLIFYQRHNYSAPRDLSPLLQGTSEIRITGDSAELAEVPEKEMKLIRSLDLILKFASGDIPQAIRGITGFGIYYFPMAEKEIHRKPAYGFSEVVRQEPVTFSTLVMTRNGVGAGSVIAGTCESTCHYSVNLTRNRIFWRSSLFVPRILDGIHKAGANYPERMIAKNEKEKFQHNALPEKPSETSAARDLVESFKTLVRQMIKKILYSDAFSWVIYYKIADRIQTDPESFGNFEKLMPGRDRFWADPFVTGKEGKYYIFVEEFIYSRNKGHISVLELDPSGKMISVSKIIDMPYHMSYPFVFESEGTYYLIPETSANNTIDLYRCTGFPLEWEYVKSIMTGIKAVDTTLFFNEGRWWLFTVIDETDGKSGCETELHLFYSHDILAANWIPHPENPVVSDVRKARPAGKIFIDGASMYRPSQDCSVRYGRAFNLNRILILDEDRYEEELVKRIEPDWDRNLSGAHTFNHDRGMTVIDAYRMRRR